MYSVVDPGGCHGPPPSPVEISHKKDGRQRWPHRFHVSWPPPPTQPLDPMLVFNSTLHGVKLSSAASSESLNRQIRNSGTTPVMWFIEEQLFSSSLTFLNKEKTTLIGIVTFHSDHPVLEFKCLLRLPSRSCHKERI